MTLGPQAGTVEEAQGWHQVLQGFVPVGDDASLERFDEELERELAALLADGRRLESEAERRSPQAPPIKHHPGVKWFS